MTDYHTLRGLIQTARDEAHRLELVPIVFNLDELLGDIEFLETIQRIDAERP